MVLAAFGFQAVGGLVGTAVGFLILFENPDIDAWRWIYASTLVLAVPVTIGRCFIVQSPLWLMFRGRIEEAQAATQRLLLRAPPYPKSVVLHRLQTGDKREYLESPSWSALFRGTNLRRTSLASVPWFLQDLGTYGIGIFTPTILATLIGASIDHPRNTAELIQSDILATKGAAFIDVLLIVGIVFAVLLADRVGRIRLQIFGFIGCAVGMLLAALSLHVGGTLSAVLLFAGFMMFSFMTNIGPNAMTYLIAGEVFPISIRGTGAGFVREDWRGVDRVFVSDPAHGHRHRSSVADSRRHQPRGRARYQALCHRNEGHQSRKDRRQGPSALGLDARSA